jgi:hypothetical protein
MRASRFVVFALTAVAVLLLAAQAYGRHGELPNRIPEPAPYDVAEAQFFPPPWESAWTGVDSPGSCSCHGRILDEWNGSMMSSSWRDPAWRGAFLLVARLTATDGNCDIPNPPDGTARNLINPFANGDCTSTFDLGDQLHTTSGSGSLADEFCSRCHMPTNYVDNVPLAGVGPDSPSGLEHGPVDPGFDPTSDNGTGLAYAELASQHRNTISGRQGIHCEVCHTAAETRYTPFHNYVKSGTEYVPALGTGNRTALVPAGDQDLLNVADVLSPSLGYGVGAGSYRLSPHAIKSPERFGPLSWNDYTGVQDPYVSSVFDFSFFYQQGSFAGKHPGFYSALFERAEMCADCHDVTNPFTIKNQLGNWVGGFPIERTYTEWRSSRYADRPGNPNFDPAFKRDCQTCHMQQNYGAPGTAQVLYDAAGLPIAPLTGQACSKGPVRPAFYSHHFIGGNAYIPRLLGQDISGNGAVQPYPELSTYSFSSADPQSVYHHAYFENVGATGPRTQHDRMAWDRLRNVLTLDVMGPTSAADGTTQGLMIAVSNTGSGHNFPSGFPEGRNAWLSVRAWDVATGNELEIFDSFWGRTSVGVGYLTDAETVDPNYPGCNWTLPAGTADPYAYQFKAVASLGDGCPTLALPYATPLNLVTNAAGLPVDPSGTVIGRANPLGLPQYQDLDGDGEVFDDAYLVDTRLRPQPHLGASQVLSRYSVVIPPATVGPVAVTAAVYYQSMEAPVAVEFLGNLADRDTDFLLEPCVLKGACDGRTPAVEPATVEGAPPVPMEVASWVIDVTGSADTAAPMPVSTYPAAGAVDVYPDMVVKVQFSEPVTGVDAASFTLVDSGGQIVPAFVDQISDGAWGLYPHQIFLAGNSTYTARVAAPVCDYNGNCTMTDLVWSFTTARDAASATGDTSWPLGFGGGMGGGDPVPYVMAIQPADGAVNVPINTSVTATFSEPVTNVTTTTFVVYSAGGSGKSCAQMGTAVSGSVNANGTGDVWTFTPAMALGTRTLYCVSISSAVMDLSGQTMAAPFSSSFTTGRN